jgi:excisionase family DNA binding protein
VSTRAGYVASDFEPTRDAPEGYDSSGALVTATVDYLKAYYETSEQREIREIKAMVRKLAGAAAAPSPNAGTDLLTATEAATALRTSRRNLNRWIASGRLRAVKGGVGGSSRVLVPRAAIVEFLAVRGG